MHLFGRPAPVEELRGLDLPIIEDAAQAFGAPGIATSIASTFSFFPTKNLFALGDGGLVSVNDAELADRIRMLRFHGSQAKKDFELIGYNSRLDAVQAAMLRIFLPHLDGWNAARREAAARLRGARARPRSPSCRADEPGHVYHMYCVRSFERDRLAAGARRGRDRLRVVLPAAAPSPAGAAATSATPKATCPRPRRPSRENLCLPMWGGISEEQQAEVVGVLRRASSLVKT